MTTPTTLYELLLWYTPPLSVVEFLQATAAQHGMSPEAAEWLERVVAVRTGDPIPEMDRFDVPWTGDPVQGELVKGPVTYA